MGNVKLHSTFIRVIVIVKDNKFKYHIIDYEKYQ